MIKRLEPSDPRLNYKPPRAKDRRLRVVLRRRVRRAIVRLALRRVFRAVSIGRKAYQPVEIGGRRLRATREFDRRWQAVSSVVKEYGAASVVDVGCAEGWMVRRCASDLNCFALGIEGTDRLLLGEVARLHDDIERMSIMRSTLTPDDVSKLPRFDVVICLSVVHHVIRANGIEAGRRFVRGLASRAAKAIVFEMGTSEEKVGSAPGHLPEMPKGQETFVREFLASCGLQNIKVVAESHAYSGETRRIFSAEPGNA